MSEYSENIESLKQNTTSLKRILLQIVESLRKKYVNSPDDLKVTQVADEIRKIHAMNCVLSISASEFEGKTLTVTKNSNSESCIITNGKGKVTLRKAGEWCIQAETGDYVDVTVNRDDLTKEVELVKKKVTLVDEGSDEETINILIATSIGNNNTEPTIVLKRGDEIIECTSTVIGSEIIIKNFKWETGMNKYTVEYLLNDEIRGSIVIQIKSRYKVTVPKKYEDQNVKLVKDPIELESVVENATATFKVEEEGFYQLKDSNDELFGEVEVTQGEDGFIYNSNVWVNLPRKGIFSRYDEGIPCEHFVFSDIEAPENVKTRNITDDGSVVKWIDSETSTVYVSSQQKDIKIEYTGNAPNTGGSSFDSVFAGYPDVNVSLRPQFVDIDLTNFDTSQATDLSCLFKNCTKLKTVDLSTLKTDKCTDMNSMFDNCEELTTLDLSVLNTKNVTDMSKMFNLCHNLSDLNINIDTSSVTDMWDMFGACNKLENLDVSSFDTSKVTCMQDMFYGCGYNSVSGTSTIKGVEDFNTENVTDMRNMFASTKLTELDLSGYKTEKLTGRAMEEMFAWCTELTTLDLSNFDVHGVSFYQSNTFEGCTKLRTIYAQEWLYTTLNPDNVDGMFKNCTSLPGYTGEDKNDGRKACWKENGGYFTNPKDKPKS